jgi:hypothetical protein
MATKLEMSEEARKILDFLETTKPHQQITYDFLRNLTGVNDIPRVRNYFKTAARRSFKKSGRSFKAIRGVGYERLDDEGKNAEYGVHLHKGRRSSNRARKLHESINYNELDALGRLTYLTNGMTLNEEKKVFSRARRNELAESVNKDGVLKASVDGILELFRRKRA